MSSLYPHSLYSYLDIFLVFLRLGGLFLLVPAFSHQTIPPMVKLVLAFALSLAIYPIVRPFLGGLPNGVSSLIGAVTRETAIGFLMGFAAYITFEAINLSAQFVGYQMGLGTAGLMDPQNQAQVSVVVPLHGWLALMIFLVSDMHHQILGLFVQSFEITRASSLEGFTGMGMLNAFTLITGKLFFIAVQMAAPFTLLILAINVAIGVLSRMMPQMNMMLFSFSITILLSFAGLYVVAPELLSYLDTTLGEIGADVLGILKVL